LARSTWPSLRLLRLLAVADVTGVEYVIKSKPDRSAVSDLARQPLSRRERQPLHVDSRPRVDPIRKGTVVDERPRVYSPVDCKRESLRPLKTSSPPRKRTSETPELHGSASREPEEQRSASTWQSRRVSRGPDHIRRSHLRGYLPRWVEDPDVPAARNRPSIGHADRRGRTRKQYGQQKWRLQHSLIVRRSRGYTRRRPPARRPARPPRSLRSRVAPTPGRTPGEPRTCGRTYQVVTGRTRSARKR
jgi:hypothetical protein